MTDDAVAMTTGSAAAAEWPLSAVDGTGIFLASSSAPSSLTSDLCMLLEIYC